MPSRFQRKITHKHGGYAAGFYYEGCEGDDGVPVWDWLTNNLKRRNYSFHEHYYEWEGTKIVDYSIWFRREDDAVLFALRWKGHPLVGEPLSLDDSTRVFEW